MDSVLPLMLPSGGLLEDPQALAAHSNGTQTQAVAQGFESMFASLLLKQMRQTLDSDTMFGKDTGDVIGGLFDHFLGQHLARSGSLGIGAMVNRYLSQARGNHERTPRLPATHPG
jgi:Rod binding domain-containing protein